MLHCGKEVISEVDCLDFASIASKIVFLVLVFAVLESCKYFSDFYDFMSYIIFLFIFHIVFPLATGNLG